MTSGPSENEGQDPRARAAAEDQQRRYGREGHEGSYAQHDESYQRYRQRHIEELDRDYAEWCRTHEEGFHRDFEQFRGRRAGNKVTNAPGGEGTIEEDRRADRLVANKDEGGAP